MNKQALFTISKDGVLSLSKNGEIANIGGCYISSAEYSSSTGRITGYIEFPHPTKKELDFTGFVVYEKSVMESVRFYVDDSSGDVFDAILESVDGAVYFYLRYEPLELMQKTI